MLKIENNQDNHSDFKRIDIEDLNLPIAENLHFKRKINEILSKIDKNVFLSLFNSFQQSFRSNDIKVGYFNFSRRYFGQLKNIKFKKIETNIPNLNVGAKNKISFVYSIRKIFYKKIQEAINSNKLYEFSFLNIGLCNYLLFLIIFSLEDLLFDSKKLN